MNDVIKHYDILIKEGNDPFYDEDELRLYMDKWDGDALIQALCLDKSKTVLEIGVGTGRLANRTAHNCSKLVGIDISPGTIEQAKSNLSIHNNIVLIHGDFQKYNFHEKFDVIYSSLTFMHFEDKQEVINKVASLLNDNGRFVLSIDKNQDTVIDAGFSKVKIYPDTPDKTRDFLEHSGLVVAKQIETEFAHIFVSQKSE